MASSIFAHICSRTFVVTTETSNVFSTCNGLSMVGRTSSATKSKIPLQYLYAQWCMPWIMGCVLSMLKQIVPVK
eukprot:12303879-Karenia_brevis.AAC.1